MPIAAYPTLGALRPAEKETVADALGAFERGASLIPNIQAREQQAALGQMQVEQAKRQQAATQAFTESGGDWRAAFSKDALTGMKLQAAKLEQASGVIDYFNKSKGRVTVDNYPQWHKSLVDLGMNPTDLPATVKNPQELNDVLYHTEQMATHFQQQIEQTKATGKIALENVKGGWQMRKTALQEEAKTGRSIISSQTHLAGYQIGYDRGVDVAKIHQETQLRKPTGGAKTVVGPFNEGKAISDAEKLWAKEKKETRNQIEARANELYNQENPGKPIEKMQPGQADTARAPYVARVEKEVKEGFIKGQVDQQRSAHQRMQQEGARMRGGRPGAGGVQAGPGVTINQDGSVLYQGETYTPTDTPGIYWS